MTDTPPHLHASEHEWAYLKQLAELCRDVGTSFDAHSLRTQWVLQDDSAFKRELDALVRQPSPTSTPWTDKDLHPAPGSAFAYLTVARMHLDALALLLEHGSIMFSLGPVVRSIIEHCARVAWALDPRCTLRERLARAFWIRVDDLQQARRLAMVTGVAKDVKMYTDMRNELRRRTLLAKFYPSEIVRDPKNQDLRLIHKQNFPGFSELVGYLSDTNPDTSWDARGVYDFLSAQTHPTMHVYRVRTQQPPCRAERCRSAPGREDLDGRPQ